MAAVIPHLAGLIDGRRTVREILAVLGARHDESELLRALDYLMEVGVIQALTPEKRRILLVKEALELLEESRLEEVALLLLDYYDKAYAFSKNKYKKKEIAALKTESDDPSKNASELIRLANNLNL